VKKRRERNQKRIVVTMRHVATRDGSARLSRTIDILLGSAARGTAKSEDSIDTKKEGPPHQAPAENTLTGGDEESNSHE